MKKILTSLYIVTFLLSSAQLSARVYKGEKSASATKSAAAGCSPATAATELNINNTRALIQTGGDMWWDLIGQPQYEIPKNSGNTALFAGSLWLGGRDVSGQLKVAALRFRQVGNDYWPGPLSTSTGEIDAQTCADYDQHFVTTRDEVAEFNSWYQAGLFDAENGTNTQSESYPNYQIPESILEWPAHGRNFDPYNEDYFLAPFFDRDGDNFYNPLNGDYPAYDLSGENDCRERIVNIYGDQNLWWVFNDKGNIHTETGAQAIGMEIRAQAFAFATNDEVNNMTFYNYELVNRSTFTLTDTYFGQWVDPDLGNAQDDYVGCDVQRGLGYCYNGDNNDEDNGGAKGYGQDPPAIGVDFFQGPFQDADGLDNPLTTDFQQAVADVGIPYPGIGIGYGDSIPDNERFGMRRFLYHNNDGSVRGDPRTGVEYYNYLRSFWKDGTHMVYGGTGYVGDANSLNDVEADYMFPGDTDPIGWGTSGAPQAEWTEVTAGNTPFDRRFMQSAGPFTLQPGAVNNITVGVVWARGVSGSGPLGAVESVRKADDKTQALFDNCFRILNGPDAPELVIQEMDNELIVYITNRPVSNNFNDGYSEIDPFIIAPEFRIEDNGDTTFLSDFERQEYSTYKFQGYKVYQVAANDVAVSDLEDPEKARLIFQCDIKDSVDRIINYPVDEELGVPVATMQVDGNNEGITKAFKVTTDQFADGDNRLVNHKSYYFIAVAYAYNNYQNYDPVNPDPEAQTRPYLGSRKGATGPIQVYQGIPHNTSLENGGTVLNSEFGTEIPVTRIEGAGNGGYSLDIDDSTRELATVAPDFRILNPTYLEGGTPVKVKVIDPLNVKGGEYTIQFVDSTPKDLSDATYIIYGGALEDTITFSKTIEVGTENILLELGVSVSVEQADIPGLEDTENGGFIEASIEFEDNNEWLSGVIDGDGFTAVNWILSGRTATEDDPVTPVFEPAYDDWDWYADNGVDYHRQLDPEAHFENVLEGTWAPFRLAADHEYGPVPTLGWTRPDRTEDKRSDLFITFEHILDKSLNQLRFLESVDIVFTDDKSKWTRVPVIEMADTNSVGNVRRGRLRDSPSVDKNGNFAVTGAAASNDEESAAFISGTGMGWFPGYAVNIETGERLNMAFGESSYLANENGRDMIWNPTKNAFEGPFSDVRLGGHHYIIVFRNNVVEESFYTSSQVTQYNQPGNRMPAYDHGEYAVNELRKNTTQSLKNVYRSGMWTSLPLLAQDAEFKTIEEGLIPSKAVVKLRVNVPFRTYGAGPYLSRGDALTVGKTYYVDKGPIIHADQTYVRGEYFVAENTTFNTVDLDFDDLLVETVNGGLPMYNFSLTGLEPIINDQATAENALDLIKAVPNPYYAYSQYEQDKLDNRIRITNLPATCTINIYTVNGTLVRSFTKDDPSTTFIDWDLKNTYRTPISSGIYLIHVDVPDVGERILKWFGMLRPIDLDAF